MFVKVSKTPNENVLRFSLNMPIGNGTFYSEESENKPEVCQEILSINGVEGIFLGADFVSITKSNDSDWVDIKHVAVASLVDFFSGINDSCDEIGFQKIDTTKKEITDPFLLEIDEVLTSKVRPSLEADGGNIEIVDFKDGVLRVRLLGACDGCPVSGSTMSNGVERILKHYFKEITSVVDI